MRTIQFDNSKEAYDSDDIKYAFIYNGLSDRLDDVETIVAEVCGANDEDNWYWILKMKNGTFSFAEGGCDYTGWDCQSHATISDGFLTAQDAINALEISDYDSKPSEKIKACLLAQIDETLPFAIYSPDIEV